VPDGFPLTSIVIPCFNHADYLAEAIDSALAQTYPAVEVIVVNDGSTDNSEVVALAYGDRIRYIRQDNAGLPAARNTGIRWARGDYILFLDADDILDGDFVAKCMRVLDAHPEAGFVYPQRRLFGRESGESRFPPYDVAELKKSNYISAVSLIRASVLHVHTFDETFTWGWEDWDFFLTLAEHGITGILLDEPLFSYRRHADKSSMLDSLLYRSRRARLQIVRAHPGLYTRYETLGATVRAATEPTRVVLGRVKRRVKRWRVGS
jgi:glycosyltransferase involved in cell wall biosynthesis